MWKFLDWMVCEDESPLSVFIVVTTFILLCLAGLFIVVTLVYNGYTEYLVVFGLVALVMGWRSKYKQYKESMSKQDE